MFRVIIAGSRRFADYDLLCRVMDERLSEIKDDITVVCGMARGADALGERYAIDKGYNIDRHPAEWDVYGKSAGYRRNEEMAKCSDALVAFWDSASRGTKHMISTAKRYGLDILVYQYDPKQSNER